MNRSRPLQDVAGTPRPFGWPKVIISLKMLTLREMKKQNKNGYIAALHFGVSPALSVLND